MQIERINIAQFIEEIPLDNPFFKFDLILIKDEYQGKMPLNGIKKSEFIEVTKKIITLKTDKNIGFLSISTEYLTKEYQRDLKVFSYHYDSENSQYYEREVMGAITRLCTRRIGRDILNGLIDQRVDKIMIRPIDSADHSFSINHKSIFINPNILARLPTIQKSDEGQYRLEETPLHIILGHEMIHALHSVKEYQSFGMRRLTTIPNLNNLEEQKTILGWGEENYQYLPMSQELSYKMELDNADWDLLIESEQNEDILLERCVKGELKEDQVMEILANEYFKWEEKSENGLRASFGIAPRAPDHQTSEMTTRHRHNLI